MHSFKTYAIEFRWLRDEARIASKLVLVIDRVGVLCI